MREIVSQKESALQEIIKFLQGFEMSRLEFNRPPKDDFLKNVESALERKLKKNAISIIETTTTISLEKLIDMSVNYIMPFKKEDKGFRDALIFYTILDHAKNKGAGVYLFLTDDQVYKRGDLERITQEHKISLEVFESLETVLSHLEEFRSARKKQAYNKMKQKIKLFLEEQRGQIENHIRHNIDLSHEYYPGSVVSLNLHRSLKKIQSSRVGEVIVGSSSKKNNKNRIKISFEVHLGVVINIELPLQYSDAPTSHYLTTGGESDKERTLQHVVSVEGSVCFDDKSYVDLQIKSVQVKNTEESFIARALRNWNPSEPFYK